MLVSGAASPVGRLRRPGCSLDPPKAIVFEIHSPLARIPTVYPCLSGRTASPSWLVGGRRKGKADSRLPPRLCPWLNRRYDKRFNSLPLGPTVGVTVRKDLKGPLSVPKGRKADPSKMCGPHSLGQPSLPLSSHNSQATPPRSGQRILKAIALSRSRAAPWSPRSGPPEGPPEASPLL